MVGMKRRFGKSGGCGALRSSLDHSASIRRFGALGEQRGRPAGGLAGGLGLVGALGFHLHVFSAARLGCDGRGARGGVTEGCQIERLRPVRLRPSHLPLLCARPSQRGPPERRIRESPSDAADTEGTESARREPMGSEDVPLAEETEPEREDRRRRRVQAAVRLVGLRASP